MSYYVLLVLCLLFMALNQGVEYAKVDPKGYIVYCPCMGRFGNQADHFLGSLAFAKAMDRTLVLPPWIEYTIRPSTQIAFDRYFDVSELEKYHRVIEMHTFMKQIAPTLWPGDKRMSFCHGPRGGGKDCAAKEGNPFGPFWDHFGISFIDSQFFAPHLSLDVTNNLNVKDNWNEIYPPKFFPVLAFTGAPASFPVEKENAHLAKYMHWSTDIDGRAKDYIKKVLPKGPFIGIHLRRDVDWDNVCNLIKDGPYQGHLFSSPQCLGYAFEWGKVTKQLCKPTWDHITKQVVETAKRMGAKSVFVSADKQPMLEELNTVLKPLKIQAYSVSDGAVHVSLAILTKADHFIGNCLSSFTAFVKRYRDSRHTNTQMPSSFWNFHHGRNVKSTAGVGQEGNKVEL